MWEKLQKQFQENIWNSEQVLQLRQQFAELDAETQSYSLIGAFAAFLALLLGSLLYLAIANHSMQSQIDDAEANIHYLQNAMDKMEDFRARTRALSYDTNLKDIDRSVSLSAFTEKAAEKSFLSKASYEIQNDKTSPPTKGVIQSSLDIHLNKVSLRQVVRLLYFLEQTQSGIEVQRMSLESKNDPQGYLWASLSLKRNTEAPKKAGT
jgi:hypothetical protein